MARAVEPLFSRQARDQYAALAWLRWRIFVNSLRSGRGAFELSALIAAGLVFALIAFGPSVGIGMGAYFFASQGHLRGVAALLWAVSLVWQLFSVLAPALAGQNPDLGHLLRYPVSFASWILLCLVYGLAAPATLIGCIWSMAIAIGISIARPELLLWTALTLVVFALFNFLLSRAVLAWIERWMAQRRTRELVTAIFLVFALVAQFFNPVLHQERHGHPFGLSSTTLSHTFSRVWAAQQLLPPGLALSALQSAQRRHTSAAASSLAWLGLWALAAGALLGIRLRAGSRGENLSEAPRPTVSHAAVRPFLDFSGPLAAVIEKDLRYLLRSGPMLYNLATPLLMVFLFGGAMRAGSLSSVRREYALPLGMIWVFLGLTRLISNNLGTEGEGIRFYFLSPTPLRTVILGKNLLHLIILGLEVLAVGALVFSRSGPPPPAILAATLAWLFFAAPANLAAGNLLSVCLPYRMNMTRMGRESGSLGNGLLSLLVQLVVLGLGAAILMPCISFGHAWLATPLLLLLAAAGLFFYLLVLRRIGHTIRDRMDSLSLNVAKSA